MKKLYLAMALLLALCLCLCACGETAQTPTTDGQSTMSTPPAESEGPEITGPSGTDPVPNYEGYAYTVEVIYDDGSPAEGVFVQICAGETCVPVATDANGIAAFANTISGDGELTAKIMESTIPEGYRCVEGITEIVMGNETNVGFVLCEITE